jgi:hypothetical protein
MAIMDVARLIRFIGAVSGTVVWLACPAKGAEGGADRWAEITGCDAGTEDGTLELVGGGLKLPGAGLVSSVVASEGAPLRGPSMTIVRATREGGVSGRVTAVGLARPPAPFKLWIGLLCGAPAATGRDGTRVGLSLSASSGVTTPSSSGLWLGALPSASLASA